MTTRVLIAFLTLLGSVGAVDKARGDGKEPSAKTEHAVKALKADLEKFEVLIYTLRPGGPETDPTWVKLVTDPKKTAANSKQVFSISEKQATGLIDYLAESGLFDRQATDPPGIPYGGWYVKVTGGPAGRRLGYWRHDLEVKPATVGVIQHLLKALDGDAKAAVERFRRDEDTSKR